MRIIWVAMLLSMSIYAKLSVAVSILPQQTFLRAIGGDRVDITVMVKPGSSPHTYEPKPSQMRDISHAALYLRAGVEFENTWIDRFRDINKGMKVYDTTKDIQKLAISGESSLSHHHEELDPHVWTSPANVKIMAKNILDVLVENDSVNSNYYQQNYERFISDIDKLDGEIRSLFGSLPKGARFMVFHPSWGYFAKEYGLVQLAIEVEGKNPKPKMVAKLIQRAKAEGIKALFTSPEFSDKTAKLIAREIGVPVIKISPLDPNWGETLLRLARAISAK